jgi:hypothetical protein
VCEVKTHGRVIVATMLDAETVEEQLSELYKGRWHVELDLRTGVSEEAALLLDRAT